MTIKSSWFDRYDGYILRSEKFIHNGYNVNQRGEYFHSNQAATYTLGYMLYPLVMLFDLETLFSSIFHRMGWSNGDDVANHCAICIYGMQRIPTPIMYLANKINSYEDMMAKHKSYWGGWRQMEFFTSMFDRPMRKYFGK